MIAKSTGNLKRVIIWGSFVSDKEFPNAIDLLLIMSDDFDVNEKAPEVKRVFDYIQGRILFNADTRGHNRSGSGCGRGGSAALEIRTWGRHA